MAKASSSYICQQCGFKSSQFLGKCPECGSWNTMVETVEKDELRIKNQELSRKAEVINLSQIQRQHYERLSTGLDEFNRVLGGGVVLGSVVLVSGDPGVGKSTLLTQLALNVNSIPHIADRISQEKTDVDNKRLTINDKQVLYVAGEESPQQIKFRVDRIDPKADLLVLNETDVDLIIDAIGRQQPKLVIVDSIQTMETSDLSSVAGSVGQVRECAHRLQKVAKSLHTPIFLVGHITKEGTIAGPKTLEHLVDVVLSLEGDQTSQFRVLRASKNRFGPTDEVGIFDMVEGGMVEVKNPSKLFLEQRVEAPGSAVVATMTGYRPILVEIQALVTKSFLPMPRRTGSGIDNNRLQLLVAVLSKRLNLPLYDQDIFVNVTGGLKVFEPAADLAICMAIISSYKNQQVDKRTVLLGEVGLLGELRNVRNIEKRATEAKKLGFTQVISPENAKSLAQAIKLALL